MIQLLPVAAIGMCVIAILMEAVILKLVAVVPAHLIIIIIITPAMEVHAIAAIRAAVEVVA